MSKYTRDEAAAHAGVSPALASRLWVALGFTTASSEEAVYDDDDVNAMRYAGNVISQGIADEDLVVQLTRTMASSIARIAEAQVEVAIERGRRRGQPGPIVDFEVVEATPALLAYMWRRHVSEALARMTASVGDEGSAAVGFADLVGFTALSQEMDEADLAVLVDRFEALAHDTVVQCGGRVVKMIGDEVMFAVEDPKAGVEIALSLADAYGDDEQLQDVRVGLAYGGVLQRQGDLYGPAVNLASRIVSIARPRTVVVSEGIHEALVDDHDYEWRSLRPRTFKGIGRVPIWRARRPHA